jgi:protein TonB
MDPLDKPILRIAAPDIVSAGSNSERDDREPVVAKREPPRRGLTITLLVSLGLHAAAALVALILLRSGAPVTDAPQQPAEIELVMEEHKGDVRPPVVPSPGPAEASPAPAKLPENPAPAEKPPIAEQSEPSTEVTDPAGQPIQEPKTETRTAEVQPSAPAPAAARPALKLTLSGTDSPSDARAWGDRVIPASPDAVFHNRPPEYPMAAAMNGEHGTVILRIHVSPQGSTAGVDVLRSSGYLLLDRAASEAVSRWRFLPAVKDGRAVESDMTMGFDFAAD